MVGFLIMVTSLFFAGSEFAKAIPNSITPSTVAETTTLRHTRIVHKTRLVTIRVKGRVIRRHDHIIVVQVARQVFHTHTKPRRRIVVPRHVVRIRQPFDGAMPVQAIIGVAPPPVTVTVTETVAIPGPTTTITGPTTTVTSPPETVTVPTTITITVPLDSTG